MMSTVYRWIGGCVFLLVMTIGVHAVPPQDCPSTITQNAFVKDLGLLADTVSWPQKDQLRVEGECGVYKMIYEQHGVYDTLLRVYTDVQNNNTVFTFRPTQQTPQGGDIHNERRLAACRFLNGSCYGMVNDRFQQAFEDLIADFPNELVENIRTHSVATVGHSLGGSLQLFMAVYLFQVYNLQPTYVLGFAGPFIGDEVFTQTYVDPLKETLGDRMWQIETMDISNPVEFDGTVEGYNVNNGDGQPDWNIWPFNPLDIPNPFAPPQVQPSVKVRTPIYIDWDDLCGLPIQPVADAYGLHDLKNYRQGLGGESCSV